MYDKIKIKCNSNIGECIMKDALNNSIAKAMTILNCFSYEKPRLRIKEISLMTGISQPTVYRMLNTLKEYKLIEQYDSI